MFLRKIFSEKNKLVWVLVDLMIVIIGVYGAFLIQNYAESNKNNKDRERIFSALKYEMETLRYVMITNARYAQKRVPNLNQMKKNGVYENFLNYRFIEPQYDYQTISYAISLQNTEIVDFELYNSLQSIYVEVKKIEHAERLLTDTALKYKSIPKSLDKSSTAFQIMQSENLDNFERLIIFTIDRGSVATRLAEATADVLKIINSRLPSDKVKAIEREIIIENIKYIASNIEEAIYLGKQFFPTFTEQEIREIYQQANDE